MTMRVYYSYTATKHETGLRNLDRLQTSTPHISDPRLPGRQERRKAHLGIQRIHDLADLLERLNSRIIRLIALGLIKQQQAPPSLIQHAMQQLIQHHLAELRLDALPSLPDLLRDVLDLDDRVGLGDPEQVLPEQGVVQRGEMCPYRGV